MAEAGDAEAASLAKARAAEWVDYTAVMQLKLAGLKLAFPLFQARKPNDAQRQAFERFVTEAATACISRRRSTRCTPIWRLRMPASGLAGLARALSAWAERSGAAVLR